MGWFAGRKGVGCALAGGTLPRSQDETLCLDFDAGAVCFRLHEGSAVQCDSDS